MRINNLFSKLIYFGFNRKRVTEAAKLFLLINSKQWCRIPRIYLTLKCNLNCPYCSNGLFYDKSCMGYSNLPYEKWIKIIGGLSSKIVIFTGGEPTLYPDLPKIINAVDKKFLIYTNLSPNFGRLLNSLNKPVSVYASMHTNDRLDLKESVINSLKALEASKNCLYYSVHIVDVVKNRKIISDYRNYFKANKIPITVNRNQFLSNEAYMTEFKKKVRCAYDSFYIGPDGNRYICVSKLVRNVEDGIISYNIMRPKMICHEYGWCSPCDEVAKIEKLT